MHRHLALTQLAHACPYGADDLGLAGRSIVALSYGVRSGGLEVQFAAEIEDELQASVQVDTGRTGLVVISFGTPAERTEDCERQNTASSFARFTKGLPWSRVSIISHREIRNAGHSIQSKLRRSLSTWYTWLSDRERRPRVVSPYSIID
jgi:hypothetical protein